MIVNLTNILLASTLTALAIVAFGLFYQAYIPTDHILYYCSENKDTTLSCVRGIKEYRDGMFLVKKITP